MRIAFFSGNYTPHIVGGAEISAVHLAELVAGMGNEVHVFTLQKPGLVAREIINGVVVHRYPAWYPSGSGVAKKMVWHLLDQVRPVPNALVRDVQALKPDIVHSHNVQGWGYSILSWLTRLNVPHFHTVHDLSLDCLRTNWFRQGCQCNRKCWDCRVVRPVKRRILASMQCSHFIFPSNAMKVTFEKVAQTSSKNAYVVRYPLNLRFTSDSTPTSDPVRLLYAGQISDHKGVRFLLEVLEQLYRTHRFHVQVVGTGNAHEDLIQKFGGQAWITFSGFQAADGVRAAMKSSDLLMIPSLWQENSPLVAYEAIAQLLPIVGSDIGGIPEFVQSGVNGRLAKPGDREHWSRALVEAVSSPKLIDQWKSGTRQLHASIDPHNLAGSILNLYVASQSRKQRLT